jgi:hypothetical protein
MTDECRTSVLISERKRHVRTGVDSAGSILSPFAGIYEYVEEYLCFIRAGYVSIN